jgi:hypothetical protein
VIRAFGAHCQKATQADSYSITSLALASKAEPSDTERLAAFRFMIGRARNRRQLLGLGINYDP